MSQIVEYTCETLAGAEISCLTVKGEPWFKGIDVAVVLGYAKPRNAVYEHVPLKFRNMFQFLRRHLSCFSKQFIQYLIAIFG